MKVATAAEGKSWKRCVVSTRTGNRGKLFLLIVVTIVIGLIFGVYYDLTPSTHPWSVLPNSALRITWLNSAPQDGQEKHRFLDIDEGEAEVVNTTVVLGPAVNGSESRDEKITASSVTPPCPADPPGLVGRLKVNVNPPSLEEQERAHPELALGGHFRPENCTARHKVAILIPYRDRRSHLTTLVHHLHPMLQRQLIEYNIYVVEQAGFDAFNRGMLMNAGFVEALKQYPFDCIILHDVDLVPENDRILYTCPDPPRHLSAAISTHGYRLPYEGYFGGVSAMTADQYKTINGFSNEFWGWGGEDDDLYNRVIYKKMKLTRYSGELRRYTMLSHKKAVPSPVRHQKLKEGKKRFKMDGLSNLKYKILKTEQRHLFTWLLVDLPRR